MGGASFTSGSDALSTPRMPASVYHETKARLHRALRDLYLCVASPIDGPAKTTFGDIDIVVAWPRAEILGLPPPPALAATRADADAAFSEIGRAIGAERTAVEKGMRAAHYAIPWPPHLLHHHHGGGDEPLYIQVDVRICASLRAFQWFLFKHAHGDLWNVLGSTIRPLGLTVDEEALWLRVPEIEGINRSRAKVRVTGEPGRVLEVLGLEDGRVWEEPFATEEGMYEYAATSPMFWVRPLGEDEGGSRVEGDKRALKANDRKRMSMRPCYRRWVEEFLPRCREEGRFAAPRASRSSVAELIFDRFGSVRGEFEERRREFEIEQQQNDIWKNRIKGFVDGLGPLDVGGGADRERTYRGCLVRALKRIVLEGDGRYGVMPEKELRGRDGRFIMENVVEFIEGSYRALGDAAMGMHDETYVEMLRSGGSKRKKGDVEGEAGG